MNNHKNVRSVLMLSPQTITNGATATANLDCKGYGDAEILITVGAATAVPASIKIFESDDTVVTNFAELTALSIGATMAADQHVRFFVDRSNGARKRYLRVAITAGAGSSIISGHGLLDRAAVNPSGTAGYGSNVVREL